MASARSRRIATPTVRERLNAGKNKERKAKKQEKNLELAKSIEILGKNFPC